MIMDTTQEWEHADPNAPAIDGGRVVVTGGQGSPPAFRVTAGLFQVGDGGPLRRDTLGADSVDPIGV